MIHGLSLGAGVQSSTVALMAAEGELTPRPDFAIFSDTQAEPASVYRWLDWLEKQLPFPVHRVTYGSLADDALVLRRSSRSGMLYARTLIPAFSLSAGQSRGILPRKCTRDYKVYPIQRKIRELLGKRAIPSNSPVLVTQWMGISFDELQRMRISSESWIENRYPLIELGMTRGNCLDWMEKHGYPRPPRSACYFCPYHSDKEWVRLRDQEPEEFQKAIEWERRYTAVAAQDEVTRSIPFLHSSCVPLDQVKFKEKDPNQFELFNRECEGMCGV
jgi:hypothetical protein